MPEVPRRAEDARNIAVTAARLPMYEGAMVSEDLKALALYFPLSSKGVSNQVAEHLKGVIESFDGEDRYYVAGLPIAQDRFGVEMFKQMALSAPLAMALIFVLMWFFFRNLKLIISPMIVAMLSVIVAMSLLVITGNTIHIMSSMIPIFIMPIAVLDAVHILSDFFDRYPLVKDRKVALRQTLEELWSPMLFTSLTTSIGFASLALTPIPPVQVFGIFVAIGTFAAWLFTIILMPAFAMLLPEKALEGFGWKEAKSEKEGSEKTGFLVLVGRFTFSQAKLIVILGMALVFFSLVGISKIVINDNPVNWFEEDHEIRVADAVMNERMAGTYMAYLAIDGPDRDESTFAGPILEAASDLKELEKEELQVALSEIDYGHFGETEFLSLQDWALDRQDNTADDDRWDAWDAVIQMMDETWQSGEYFKNPEVLRSLEKLESHLLSNPHVGKVLGLPEVVKTLHRELFEGDEERYRVPETGNAVAQTLMTYESSHRPQDLWHFVTPDFKQSVLWIQMNSGNNVDMKALVDQLEIYLAEHPLPAGLESHWFGLTYINVIWQEQMVSGMAKAFLSSFVVVLLLMSVLFRSLWWGMLSMIPLAFTIVVIYGILGWLGKEYDMPVAVLSSLSLGLAVDYAIHFLARTREAYRKYGDWGLAMDHSFGEPARAIVRNVIVIGLGFSPLLFAPLVPYQTVGVLISSILVLAGVASLLLLPAMIRLIRRWVG